MHARIDIELCALYDIVEVQHHEQEIFNSTMHYRAELYLAHSSADEEGTLSRCSASPSLKPTSNHQGLGQIGTG